MWSCGLITRQNAFAEPQLAADKDSLPQSPRPLWKSFALIMDLWTILQKSALNSYEMDKSSTYPLFLLILTNTDIA